MNPPLFIAATHPGTGIAANVLGIIGLVIGLIALIASVLIARRFRSEESETRALVRAVDLTSARRFNGEAEVNEGEVLSEILTQTRAAAMEKRGSGRRTIPATQRELRDGVALARYASSLAAGGGLSGVAEIFARAFSIDDKDPEVVGRYATFLMEQGDTVRAANLFRSAEGHIPPRRKTEPGWPDSRTLVAFARFVETEEKDEGRAHRILLDAVLTAEHREDRGGLRAALLAYAAFAERHESWERPGGLPWEHMEKAFTDAIEDAPNDAGLIGAYASLMSHHDRDRAVELAHRAIEAAPQDRRLAARLDFLLFGRSRSGSGADRAPAPEPSRPVYAIPDASADRVAIGPLFQLQSPPPSRRRLRTRLATFILDASGSVVRLAQMLFGGDR